MTRPYPKQPPSPGEILAIGKPATQARMIGERTSFFEGALLPGTETGRAGVFSRTTHHDQRTILPRAAPTTARATSNRVRSRSPCSMDPSSQHGKPSARSHRPVLEARVSAVPQPGEDLTEAALVPARDHGGSPPGCPPSTASLSSPGMSQDSCHQVIRGGGETVGDQHFLPQGQATSSYSVGSDDRVRRLQPEVGHQLSRDLNHRSMDTSGESPSQQLSKAAGNMPSIEVLHSHSEVKDHLPAPGQCLSCPLNFMAGPHPLHVPSICIDIPVLREAEDREGHSHPDSPNMATTELVSTVAVVPDRRPNPTASITGHPDRCGGSVPPNINGVIGPPPIDRLDVIHNDSLSFNQLSHKLARWTGSDLMAPDLGFRFSTRMGVKFVIPGLTKTRRQRPPIETFYLEFIEDPHVCPIHTLQGYERRSKEYNFHTSPGRPLLMAARKPHKPVIAATIGCWLRSIMSSAGTLCGY